MRSEKEITAAIRQVLRNVGCLHWKQLGTLGMPRGLPDIIGAWDGGRLLGIEVKTEKGRLSPEQQQWIDSINRAGGLAFVARSIDDVIDRLEIRDRFLF